MDQGMAREYNFGLMGEYMMDNIKMISDTDMVFILSQMDAFTEEAGMKASNMEQVNILNKMEKKLMGAGPTVRLITNIIFLLL